MDIEKKRVLVINTARTGLTGITSVMRNLVDITKENVDYSFVLNSVSDKRVQLEMQQEYGKIYIAPVSRLKRPMAYYLWLKEIIDKGDYDIVHVHGNSGTMYIEIHAAKRAQVPVRIAHAHSTSCKYQLAHKILKPLLNREITIGIACSDFAGKFLFDKKFQVLENGINIKKYTYSEKTRTEYRDKLELQEKFVIGHIGYFEQVKNHSFVIKVFAEVLKKRPEARLLLIGEGSLKETIISRAKEFGIENAVFFLGNRDDVDCLYQAMDVFILPSLYEGLPVTLIEAQAAGLDCITSEYVTSEANVTGSVSYQSINCSIDVSKWAEALIEYHAVTNREARSKKMQKSQFDSEISAQKLLGIYGVTEQ